MIFPADLVVISTGQCARACRCRWSCGAVDVDGLEENDEGSGDEGDDWCLRMHIRRRQSMVWVSCSCWSYSTLLYVELSIGAIGIR